MNNRRVSISVPCYNEEENVENMALALLQLFDTEFPQYEVVVQFIDNCSTDNTKMLLRKLCNEDKRIKVIFNARNFPLTSGYYGIIQTDGDCTIAIPCDFQVPLNTISQMLKRWENGAKIVCLVKKSSKEKGLMWHVRQLYYRIANKFSETEIIRNFTGCGLYDKSFLDICRSINDPIVSFGQMIVTLGYDVEYQEYIHAARKRGRSKNSLLGLINMAFIRFTNASTMGPRIASIGGLIISACSFIIGLVYLVLKLLFWNNFVAGMAPVLIGVFFMGSLQLFFIGLLGEYVLKANQRLMNRPLVVERERLNFFNDNGEKNDAAKQ